MTGFITQDVHVNKMVKTKNRYILNVGQVGYFQTPRLMAIRVTIEVHSMGPDNLCIFLK
jgi:hypothetical protein